jgi:hypothetical protein
MCPRKVSHKTDIFCALCKEKKYLEKWIILAPKFVFFTQGTKMSVFAETTL